MLENIRLAFQGIWAHKMRAVLTMLGIIIGIASIISIVSTIKGTNEQIKKNLIGSGNNTVEITLTESGNEYDMEYEGLPEGIPVITEEVRQELLEVSKVEDAALYNYRTINDGVYYQNSGLTSGTLYGTDQNYFDTCGYQVTKGRLFVDKDFDEFRKVAVIDTDTARNLFQDQDPIGKTIEIKEEPFTIIGLVEQTGGYELSISTVDEYYTYMSESSGGIFIPSTTWPILYRYDEPQCVVVRASSTEDMNDVGSAVAKILNNNLSTTNENLKYKAANTLDRAKSIQELSDTTNKQLIWIASISLLVGGIGVMNIMLVSVTERTSEIGLKKAIGARNETILYQFLTEAVVLTSMGGILGVVAGIILSQVISKVSDAPVAISIPAILVSVLFSMLIGIVFGLLPSIKAAQLNPIDALRHE
jgi:putative ABC transport system permease protein